MIKPQTIYLPFKSCSQLRSMIKGYEMLFDNGPQVAILAEDEGGRSTGLRCEDGTLWFTGIAGAPMLEVHRSWIVCEQRNGETIRISPTFNLALPRIRTLVALFK